MENHYGTSQVPTHPTHTILDSSKMQTLQSCPRKFFFRHILGFENEEPNIHLAFGSAWHEAMEHMMNSLLPGRGYPNDEVGRAFLKFRQMYEEKFPSILLGETLSPNKSILSAFQALEAYASQYATDDFDTLWTEIAGTVPIASDRIIHFKVDSIIRDSQGLVWSMEHKTSGRNTNAWREQWRIKFQIGCYSHVLHCLAFEPGEVEGIIINGAFFYKNDQKFLRIPVRRTEKDMLAWLDQANHLYDYLEWNMESLCEAKVSDPTIGCFHHNAESCAVMFGCDYPGLCEMANPLTLLEYDSLPPGYTQRFWDPSAREKEMKNVFHLEGKQ